MAGSTAAIPARRLTGVKAGSRRTWVDRIMRTVSGVAAISCVIPLAAVLIYVTLNGLAALNLDLLTKPFRAAGVSGGALGAILGTLQMVGLASLMAIPVGILAGVYVNEFSSSRSARGIRFAADVLVGVPSILIGVFVCLLTGFLPLGFLLHLTNIGTLFAFVVVCAAVLIMRRKYPNAERPFRCPWVPFVPVMGILSCLLLMFSLPAANWYRLVVWMLIGLVIYFSYGYRHSLLAIRMRQAAADKTRRR
jgi:hypothetical protein